MELIKPLKKSLKAVLENNNFKCSICIQNVDSYVMSFAKLDGASVSWRKNEMIVFVPYQSSFTIPYKELESYQEFPCRKQIEIALRGRILVSIREAH